MESTASIGKERRDILSWEVTSASLAAEGQRAFSDLAPAHVYPAATGLFEQGFAAGDVYFIEAGLVKLTAIGEAGQELIVGLRPAGRTLGACSVILKKAHPNSAVTLTRCELRRLPGEALLYFLRNDVVFSRYVHQENSREVYDHVAQLVGLGCLSARCRLERLLIEMVPRPGTGSPKEEIHLQLLVKHWEIAQLIAITPQHLSRVLKAMEADGVIRQEKGRIILIDLTKLGRPPDF